MEYRRFCCEEFDRRSYSAVRGVAVGLIYRPKLGVRFFMKCSHPENDDPIDLAQDAIRFCPWCGCDLQQVVGENKPR